MLDVMPDYLMVLITIVYSIFTYKMLKSHKEMVNESQKNRELASRPEVIAYFYLKSRDLLIFKIKNIGKGLALNSTVKIDPYFDRWTYINDTNLIDNEIKLIAPNQELETFVGQLSEIYKDNNEYPKFNVEINYESIEGMHYSSSYYIDLKDYAGCVNIVEYGIHDIATTLQEVEKQLKQKL